MLDNTASLIAQAATKVASVPAATKDNLLDVARALKNIVDVREGKVGNPLDANVTYRDLVDAGVVTLRPGWNSRSNSKSPTSPVMPPLAEPDGYDPTTDLIPPPPPSNFTATGLFAMVQLQWDTPTYRNHGYAEIWRAETNALGNAIKIATSNTSFFADSLGTGATRYYWVRFVSQANINGPYQGVDGVSATTASNPALIIGSLTGQITQSQLHNSLSTRIDLIDADFTVLGSVNYRVAAEASARAQAIAQEALTRADQIAFEAAARASAIQAEATVRAQDILAEAQARANAISAEAMLRQLGDQNEASARAQAIADEQNARAAAIIAEAQARADAILAEAQARQAAITAERVVRQTAEESLAADIEMLSASLTTSNGITTAAILNEQSARATAISAEASARESLATQLTGGYGGTDPSFLSTGLIFSERTSRITAEQNLQTQINTLVAASSGDFGELFAAITEEQTARVAGDTANASATSLLTSRFDNVKDASGNPTNKTIEATLTENKAAQVSGDQALLTSISTLSATVTNNYNTLSAAVQSESTARTTAISAEAVTRESLATQIRGGYSGTDVTQVSAGLIYSERTSRAAADSNLQSQITNLSATVTTNNNTLTTAIQNEQTARANAVSAESASRETLAAQLRGAYTGSDPSLLTTGILYNERQVRINAEGAISSSVAALSATVTNNFNTLNAAISAEQIARADADTAFTNNFTNLTATVATKNRTFYQSTAPTATATGDLWFDSANNNQPKRWSGTAWIATEDTRIAGNTAAITAEQTARATADTALTTSISNLTTTVTNNYNTLNAAVTNEASARSTADTALSTSITNLTATVGTKNKNYFQTTAPAVGMLTGDVWYDTDDNNKAYRYNGTTWVATDDTRIATNIAAITSEATARASADTVLTNTLSTLSSTVTNNYDTLNAAIINEASTRATADTAVTTQINTVSAVANVKNRTYYQTTAPLAAGLVTGDIWFDSDDNNKSYRWSGTAWAAADDARIAANSAAIVNEQNARASADSSLATSISTLTSTVTNNNSNQSAAVVSEAAARSEADAALSSQITALTSTVSTNNSTLTSSIQNEATTRANADAALTTSINTLQSTVNTNNTTLTAAIQSEATTRANADSALTTSINTLQSTVNSNNTALTASIQTEATTRASVDTGLLAQYTVKTDVNGYVSGFGLASTANNATASSTFAVRADTFYIANPTGPSISPAMPFIVRSTSTTINGVSVPAGVYMTDAFIQNGTITNAKIANLAVDNAKIASLDATKITTGFLNADRIQAGTLDAKIANIDAARITSGVIDNARIGNLDAGKITTGQLTADRINGTNLTITASGVQLGKDVGPGTGHYGLSLAEDNFANIFLRRSDGVVFFRINETGTNRITFDSESGNLNIKSAGFSVENGVVSFTGTVIDTSNIYNESVNIFKLARGASLPDYVRTYKGATTPQVTVGGWMPLQLDNSALNNKIGATDYDAYRTLLPAGTYFYELSVPVKCQGSDTNDAAYTAIILNPPGTPAGTYQTQCYGYSDGKGGYFESCYQVYTPTAFQVLSTSGVNVVGDWQTATIFGVGRFTLASASYISAAVQTTDGYPALNVVARNGYSTTILRIWRDGNA